MSESTMSEKVRVDVLAVLSGFTNPESAEMLPDGETIVVSNAAISLVPGFRDGKGLTYRLGDSYVSTVRFSGDRLEFVHERLIEGLTGTIGTDVLRTAGTAIYPVGTVFAASGGKPITADGDTVVPGGPHVRQQVFAYDPVSGEKLPPIPLWEGSVVADVFNALEQPNGLAVGLDGDVYVTDIPNSNPDGPLPAPVDAAVYRLPNASLDALAAGDPAAGATVQRVVMMPGWVNGVTVSPVDGTVWAVSCSGHDPVGGGAYQLLPEHFVTGQQPEPRYRDLGGAPGGFLDGITMTRRGSLVVSNPATTEVFLFDPDGRRSVLEFAGADELGSPADINVCYPTALGGEPALIVPDVSARGGTHSVRLLDLSGH